MKATAAPQTITAALDETIGRFPDREAIRSDAGSCTYGELDGRVDRAAWVLRSLGVRRGSAVAASLANREELVVAFLAAMRLGARWVGLNRALTPGEKKAIMRHTRAPTSYWQRKTKSSRGLAPQVFGPRLSQSRDPARRGPNAAKTLRRPGSMSR